MAYGELKVDSITFTDNGTDTTVSVSGLVQNPTFSGDITVTGTISGSVVQGGTTVSGATVTGTAGEFGTVTGNTAGFTTVTGTTVTGSTANFVSGTFTTQVSGATVTGNLAQFTTLTGATAGFTTVTGTTVTGSAGQFGTVTGNTAGFTTITGTTVTGTTASFTSGVFTSLSGTTATVTSGVFASGTAAAPSVSVGTTDNGLYSPGTDEVALATNGTGRLFIDSSGRLLTGVSSTSVVCSALFQGRSDGATNSANIRLAKGSSTPGTTDSLGIISFADSGTQAAAQIQASRDGGTWTSSSRTPGALLFFTAPDSVGSAQERLRITSDGKVGVGTSNPDQELVVRGSQPFLELRDKRTGNWNFGDVFSGLLFSSEDTSGGADHIPHAYIKAAHLRTGSGHTNADAGLEFGVSPSTTAEATTAMSIAYPGRVGVGTNSPNYEMVVRGSQPFLEIRDNRSGGWDQEDVFSGILFGTEDTTFTVDPQAFIKVVHTRAGSGHSSADAGLTFGTAEIGVPAAERVRITYNGNVGINTTSPSARLDVNGSLSKSSGSFKIDHPLPEKNETHYLVHSFVEAPDASNLYAGMVDLVDGVAVVNIDTAHRMSEGTFEALNTVQSWSSSNESGYAPVKCSIVGNLLTIECQDSNSNDTVYYEVRGIRKDVHMLSTEWTDEKGRVITEPLKQQPIEIETA